MNHNRHHLKMPLMSSRVTATVTVCLVLVLIGMGVMAWIAAGRATGGLGQRVSVVTVLTPSLAPSDTQTLLTNLKGSRWCADAAYVSPAQVLERWQEMAGDDEDVLSLAGENPFSGEIHLKVNKEWANGDSLRAIGRRLELRPEIEQVRVSDEIIEGISHTAHRAMWVFGIGAGLLWLISITLIFNTIRLAVYTRRFAIYTMMLVGATRGFVSKPYIIGAVANGAIAGLVAGGCICGLSGWLRHNVPELQEAVTWPDTFIVGGGLIVGGIVLCVLATWAATHKYLSQKYDQLFR